MADNPNEPNEQATAQQDTTPADGSGSGPDQAAAKSGGTNKKGTNNTNTGKALGKRSWHPSFAEGVRLVWDPKMNNLEFLPEFAVTSEPIKTDILIVKNDPNVKFKDRIGSSFKEYNFIQFKSRTDSFGIDDLYTELGYVTTYLGRKTRAWLKGYNPKEQAT